MMQPMQGARRQSGMGEREWQANLVIERCMGAIFDHATRPGASRAKVMRALKSEGFTAHEIAEATRRMGAHDKKDGN